MNWQQKLLKESPVQFAVVLTLTATGLFTIALIAWRLVSFMLGLT